MIMRKKKRLVIGLVVTLMILIYGGYALFAHVNQERAERPQAINGVMDLRNYDFSNRKAIPLNGEWEFIPGELADATSFDKQNAHLVQVPSLWTKHEIDGNKVPKFTSGTYRLIIMVDEPDRIYGIKTGNIRMSNEMIMNGKRIGGSGTVGEDISYVPNNIPYAAYFSPGKQEIELLVRVANFHYASGGGILGSIFLGDQASIGKLRESSLVYDWVTITAFLTMFIYFLGSYLHARIDISQLFFSLFCFANVLYAFSHGEKVLFSLFPATPYEIFERIQAISSILFGLFMLFYFHYSLKDFARKKIVNLLCIAGVVLAAAVLLPIQIHSSFQSINSMYIFMVLVYVVYVQIIAAYHRSTGAAYLIISTLTILVYFIVGTLNVTTYLELTFLPPLLPFICLTMLSWFISHRFTDNFLKKEELSNALLRVDKMKDEFLAKTSHEFRTPLHGIIAISQSMLDKNGLTTDQKEKMSLIVSAARRLSHLVNDILDFSKLREGGLKLVTAPVDLFAATHVVVETFSYMINKDVQIINHVERGQYVLADEDRLRQILYNLIENAVKYTDHGLIEIHCFDQQDQVVIQISDTGMGIPPDHVESIFESFRQFEYSVGGSGLGLSVTKELVNLQGGDIKVNSVVGKGTTFSFTLPGALRVHGDKPEPNHRYDSNTQSVQLPIPYIYQNEGRKKIIIADDDRINLKVIIDTLNDGEYYLIAVDSGQGVLEQIKKHPDTALVILDIMMPELSGYEVCQHLRKSYHLSELPILMLTAAIRPEDMIAAFQSGANDFLHKPLDVSELKTRIRNLILMKDSAETAAKMEVAFLQAQIKPHFVYNVLNSILALSYADLEKARMMITDFAHFLRGSFSFENTSTLVALEKELSLIQSYVNIHRTRFPEQLEWKLKVEGPVNGLIPPLLLQPLVENAILHGLKMKAAGGQVKLTVTEEKGMMIFRVTDNGAGMSEEQLKQLRNGDNSIGQGVGIKNIINRLKYYEDATIHFESEEGRGTTVELRFPQIFSERKG